MRVDETVEQLIKSGNYPKFIAYLHQLYELQKKAYAEGVNLFDPDELWGQIVITAAAESPDIRFLQALFATQDNPKDISAEKKYWMVAVAAKVRNINVLSMLISLFEELPTLSYQADPECHLYARKTLATVIRGIQNTPRYRVTSIIEGYENDILNQLKSCVAHQSGVVWEFIQDIINLRRNNPFTFIQWQHFVKLVSMLDPQYADLIDLNAIAKYDHVTAEKILTAIQSAATDVVNTLQKMPTDDPELWEDCIWYFKTPNAKTHADRYFKVKTFLGKQDARFALYTEDPYRIPNLTNAGHLDAEKLKSIFQLKCAEIMATTAITTKSAPNLKAYVLEQRLDKQWEKLWSDLHNSSAQWTAGWVDAKWIKRLLQFLIALNQAKIPFALDPNQTIYYYDSWSRGFTSVAGTPLSIALEQQRPDLVELLLQLPQVNQVKVTQDGKIPIHLAAKNTAITNLLLAHPQHDQFLQITTDDNRNALFFAVEADNPETVELLLNAGINVECSHYSWTALMYAIMLNKITVIPTLIANLFAKNPEIKLDIPNLLRVCTKCSATTLSLAVEHLIFANANKGDPNALLLNYKKLKVGSANLLKLWESFKFDVNAVAADGLTILQRACSDGNTAIVVDLLKIEGIEINVVNQGPKYSALHFALQHHHAIALLLLDAPKIKLDYEVPFLPLLNFKNQTALLEKLISLQQFDVNSKFNEFECFLSALISYGLYTLAEKLVQQRPSTNVDLVIGQGQSPLQMVDALLTHNPKLPLSKLFALMIAKSTAKPLENLDRFIKAAERKDLLVLDALLAMPHLMDTIGPAIPELINRMTKTSSNPARDFLIARIMLAKDPKTKATLQNLVTVFKFDINAIPKSSTWTLLHGACSAGDINLVNDLLTAGADVNRLSTINKSPLYIALASGHESIVLRLLDCATLTFNPQEAYFEFIDFNRHAAILEKLIPHHHFDVNSEVNRNYNFGCILSTLISRGLYPLAEKLLHRPGVDVDLVIGQGTSPIRRVIALLDTNPNPPVSKLFALMIPRSKEDHLTDRYRFSQAAQRNDLLVLDALLALPKVIDNIGPMIPKLICQMTTESSNPARDLLIERLLAAKTKQPKLKATVKNLIDAFKLDVNIDTQEFQGTMLHQACDANDLRFVNELLAAGADVNCVSSTVKKSALYHTLFRGQRDAIALCLLGNNNLKLIPDELYLKNIHFGTQRAVVEKLMAHPLFDVNCKVDSHTGSFLSTLIYHQVYDLAEKVILRGDINVDLVIDQSKSPLRQAESSLRGDTPNLPYSKMYALMIPKSTENHLENLDRFLNAAKRKDVLVLDALLAIPAVINNIGPKIPLLLCHLTIDSANPARDFLIERLLFAKNKKTKATLKNLADTFQFDVNTPTHLPLGTLLFFACDRGDINFLNDLLTLQVNGNCINSWADTPLRTALSNRHYAIAMRLLDEPNLTIHLGRPLMDAIDYRNQGAFFQKLITHPKFNVNCVYDNDYGNSLLTQLLHYGYYDAAETLLQRPGVDVDLKMGQGLSPIDRATELWRYNDYNSSPQLSRIFALMLPLSRAHVDRSWCLDMAAERDDQVVITALMKMPEVTQSDSALQKATARNHYGSITLLQKTMIRNYGELMKKLLENKFVCSAGFGWNGLLNHVVLCNGFHTPKIESAAIKLANLLYVLEWPNMLNPNPETLLRKIIDEDPNIVNEFIEPIKTKQYPSPFSKTETLLRFATLLEKGIGQRIEFPVEKPVVPVAVESVATVVVGTIATPVAIEPSVPKLSSIGSFFKSLTASSATASAPELSEAQKAALLAQKAAIIERNNKIQAELEEAETQRAAMEKEIQRKVQQDVTDHLMLADLTTDDLKALVSLYDTRKGIPDSEIIAREQLHAKAMDLGEKTGSQLARFILCPELLFDKPQTPITLRLAMEYLLPCIKKELQRLPEPRPVNVPLTPAQLLALQAARVRGYLPQKTVAVGPQSQNDDDDNDTFGLNNSVAALPVNHDDDNAKAAMNSGL